MNHSKLLIVDNDTDMGRHLQEALAPDCEVLLAHDRTRALHVCTAEQPAVVILDLGLHQDPGDLEEGLQTLSDILQENAAAKVIVTSDNDSKEYALRAIGQGAYDFFRKPIALDELQVVIRRAL